MIDTELTGAWIGLFDELDEWEKAGKKVPLWWRDDDAQQPGPQLDRLIELSELFKIPLLLAVIPQGTDEKLAARLAATNAPIWVAQHGISHTNNAPAGEKNTELHDQMLSDPAFGETLRAEGQRLKNLFGDRYLPVMVAPWNRIGPETAASLSGWGYVGLSTDGDPINTTQGVIQANTHVDPINWRQDRAFFGSETVIANLTGHIEQRRKDPSRPQPAVGFLTHHIVHERALWTFISQLFTMLGNHPAVDWASPDKLFAQK